MPGLVESDPVTLSKVLISKRVIPGDTIWLRAGTYTFGSGLAFQDVSISGTAAKPVVIRNYPGETVRINGGLDLIAGSQYVTIRGIEIAPTPTARYSGLGRKPEANLPTGLRDFWGKGCKIINCIIHDCSEGLEIMGVSPFEMYGNLIYNYGWYYDAGPTGYGIYTHNQPANKIIIKHNIFAGGFGGYSVHANASSGNKVTNYDVIENVHINGCIVAMSGLEVSDFVVDKNHVIEEPLRAGAMGYYSANKSVTFTNNRVYAKGPSSGIGIYDFQSLTVTGNIFTNAAYATEIHTPNAQPPYPRGTWNNNTYHSIGQVSAAPFRPNGVSKSLADWRAITGYDADSTLDTVAPARNEVFVYANEYADKNDIRKGIVVIWNWEGLPTVNEPLSALGLSVGKTYRWRQAQDPFADTGTFVYNGTASFDMQAASHTVAIPTGYEKHVPLHETSFPVFGSFLIEAA